ncbi:MAG: hypothetical protein EB053_01265 [Chlamydiae bacterium]|nr:hypothetical protein [Chlamydiota bacterium]
MVKTPFNQPLKKAFHLTFGASKEDIPYERREHSFSKELKKGVGISQLPFNPLFLLTVVS